jgi:hypothetical protein
MTGGLDCSCQSIDWKISEDSSVDAIDQNKENKSRWFKRTAYQARESPRVIVFRSAKQLVDHFVRIE